MTGEHVSIEVPNPENYLWFVWSPSSATFAITNGQVIVVGEAFSPDQLEIPQSEGYLGRIAWHPSQNQILVGSRGINVSQGFNQLWQLNLDTSSWHRVGSYPHIAHAAFSPNGQQIAIHSQYTDVNRLVMVDGNTFETILLIELPSELFFDLDWLNDGLIAFTSRDNVFVISPGAPAESYWVFNANSPLYDFIPHITFTDW
jgi:hypothetical protein